MTVSSPINIALPRGSPSSPYSNLDCTTNSHSRDSNFCMSPVMNSSSSTSSNESSPQSTTAAAPIAMESPNMESHPRRDSISGSLTQGMSWGGYSIGSWIRDDMLLAGTSPYAYQLSSFGSSSYFPTLEERYLRNFACCGSTIPSLHDLLQHYETTHVHHSIPHSLRASYLFHRSRQNSRWSNRVENSSPSLDFRQSSMSQTQQQQQQYDPNSLINETTCAQSNTSFMNLEGVEMMQQRLPNQHENYPFDFRSASSSPELNNSSSESDDMELDDAMSSLEDMPDTPPELSYSQPDNSSRQSFFNKLPQLSLDLSSTALQFSGLRNSQPPTPASAGFNYQNNPTVSSVNTPTLSAQPMSHSQPFTPLTSAPVTPMGHDGSEFINKSVKLNDESMNPNLPNFPYPYPIGMESLGNGYCIDEPAKRLYSPNGFNNLRLHQLAQLSHMQGSLNQNDAFLQSQSAQQPMPLPHPHAVAMMMASEEQKPFRCPVIGCEKAYKNQNGLKYHKTHGHNTQQLHENGDGTFSIVNPETSAPYPGTLGMDKEKPYKCDSCSKRYKNLNGLKYHNQHSPPCNPELSFNNLSATTMAPLPMDLSGICNLGGTRMMM